jgi:hypothetical protein
MILAITAYDCFSCLPLFLSLTWFKNESGMGET